MSRLNRSISSNSVSANHGSNGKPPMDPSSEYPSSHDPTSQCGALGFGLDMDELLSSEFWSNESIEPNGVSHATAPRHFYAPMHYESKYRYPLIVWLHNDGFNENQISQVMPHISLRNYVAVGVRGNRAADSAGHRFDWHDSASAIRTAHDRIVEAIDEATFLFSIHPDRVVLAGYRSGGTMALRIAMRDPARFAAVASFGGRMPSGSNVFGDLKRLRERRMAMLWQWAEDHAGYQPDGLKEDIQSAMEIRAKVDILQCQGDDEMNTVALSKLNQWIMSRVVDGAATNSAFDRWGTTPTEFSCN